MDISNGVTLIRTASTHDLTGLLIKSEVTDRHVFISGDHGHMAEVIAVITKRLNEGFSFDVLRDYAQFTIKRINQGA